MRRRNKEILFRLTQEENDIFEHKVLNSGLSKQKYLHKLIFNNDIQPVHRDDERSTLNSLADKMKQFIIKIGVTR